MRSVTNFRLSHKSLVVTALFLLAHAWCLDLKAEDRKDIERDLRSALEHKILALKNPRFSSKLEFDSFGNPRGNAVAGPWSTCGLMEVEKVKLGPDRLEIFGKRIVLGLRAEVPDPKAFVIPSQAKVTEIYTYEKVHIWVDMPSSDSQQIKNQLSQIFTSELLQQRVDAYWKPMTDPHEDIPKGIVGELEGGRPVYMITKGKVVPPQVINAPDPDYSDSGRRDRLQGVARLLAVVNEKGFPEVLEITQSLGDSLDVRALAAVAHWTFRPATKDGQPVASVINVEVNFRLF